MTRIHDVYTGYRDDAFAGTRDDLVGGEYLGPSAQPHLFVNGDIVTEVRIGNNLSEYYYDPSLRISGSHFVYYKHGGTHYPTWVSMNTKDVPA